MKTAKIKVNKTAEQPDGVEIEVVQPEGEIEERLLIFTLRQLLQTAKEKDRLNFDLPEGFQVLHQREGSFVVAGFGGQQQGEQPGYYQPPAPVAVVGLRTVGNQFDMIHAAVDPEQLKAQQQAQQQQPQQAAANPSDASEKPEA